MPRTFSVQNAAAQTGGNMRGGIDTALKVAAILVLLMIGTSVSYYYAIYLPERDTGIEQYRRMESARAKAEADRKAEELAGQKAAEEILESARKGRVQIRYENCLNYAQSNYNATWNSNCEARERVRITNYRNCISDGTLGKTYCDRTFGNAEATRDCSLPHNTAQSLNDSLEKRRSTCLQEFQAGLE